MAVPYPVPARHSPSRPSILHTTSWCNKGPFRPRRVWRVWSFGRRTRPESLPRPPKRPAKAANKACWALFFVPLARFLPLLPSRSVDGCCSDSGWVVPSHGALSLQPDPTIRCPLGLTTRRGSAVTGGSSTLYMSFRYNASAGGITLRFGCTWTLRTCMAGRALHSVSCGCRFGLFGIRFTAAFHAALKSHC